MRDEAAAAMGNGSLSLVAHPRLYIGPREIAAAKQQPDRGFLRAAAEQVAADAAEYVGAPDFDEVGSTHNAHLLRARRMQRRVLTLVVRWLRTGEQRYRDSAIAHVDTIGRWEYWSWIAWRKDDPRPEAIFDLSYGENSATLALAYDLLYDDLNAAQRTAMTEIARRRSLQPFLHVLRHEQTTWFGRPDSNWNTVCAGGAGMLALAMREELDEADAVLAKVEESIEPFMRTLEQTDGGWPEGIGYWNYGMRYGFMYLLSHERATGQPHPLLRAEATRRTLSFPLDFCPHGEPCSFGDVNRWAPLPFHYAVAERLDAGSVLDALDAAAQPGWSAMETQHWPVAAEALLLHPRHEQSRESDARDEPVRIYDGLGWARLADRWPDPHLYLSIRGGTTEVPHGHLDLLSFHAVVGDERLIENLAPAEYLDTTFSPRRAELFEIGPHSKNAPLIDGVGVTRPARTEPVLVRHGEFSGLRLDATEAMGNGREEKRLAEFCGRLFVLFGHRAALVVDRIVLRYDGRVESRLHTRATVDADRDRAHLTGARQRMSIAFAADAAFDLTTAATVPTTPGDTATVLRWCGPQELGRRFWTATLLVPGDPGTDLRLEPTSAGANVQVRVGDWATELSLADDLTPAGQ